MNDIEEKFYKTFGIEPKEFDEDYFNKSVEINGKRYPKITSDILLELICIIVKCQAFLPIFASKNFNDLKEEILIKIIGAETKYKHNLKFDIKSEVQSLFKGGE